MALIPPSYGFEDRRIIKTIRGTARPQTRINLLAPASASAGPAGGGDEGRQRMRNAFLESRRYELEFWESAWRSSR